MSSSSEAYNARLQEIRSRQQNWMRQRESAIEREKVEADLLSTREPVYYEDEGGDEAGPSTSGGQGSSRQDRVERTVQRVAPEEIVDALTIRLAEKIKAELQLEDRAELSKSQAKVNREKAKVNKLEGYLAKEIASHKCPICYELMIPPDHAPLLLFPCGHTFCNTCLRTHEKYNRRKCPYCRKKIESTAANISLQQLIENYVHQKDRLRSKAAAGPGTRARPDDDGASVEDVDTQLFENAVGGEYFEGSDLEDSDNGGEGDRQDDPVEAYESYLSQYRSVDMRVKILENELLDTREEHAQFEEDLSAANKVLEHLLREKQTCLREEERIRKIKEMIRDQLQSQEAKLRQVTEKKENTAARSALIAETLKPLHGELDKLRLLIEGMETGGV